MVRKHLLLPIFIGVLALSSLSLGAQSIPEAERAALVAIYKATGGTNWHDPYRWDLSKDASTWQGVTIKEGHVTELFLEDAGLVGNFPGEELLSLPHLSGLLLGNNGLTGPIPSEIGKVKTLTQLRLGNNKFTGEVPDLSQLVLLEFLFINDLAVSGSLPDITKMPDLLIADFSNCQFSGSLPMEIGNCSKMLSFDVTHNKLSGEVPRSFTRCIALMDLSLQDNEFSGAIPDLSGATHLGEKNEFIFGRCYFNDNQFTGPFPEWAIRHASLSRFTCQNNKLEGEFPQDLSGMVRLEVLYAGNNKFTGTMPGILPSKIEELDLSYNKLTGPIPNYSEALALSSLFVQGNELSGKVPPFYKKVKGFANLNVMLNRFSFADFADWKKYATSRDVIFRVGLQRAYQENKKVELAAGDKLQLDATYQGKGLIGNCKYQWYRTDNLEPIKGATSPILTVEHVSEAEAFKHVCFITTDYFGDWKEYDLREVATMPSGIYDVWVDGKSLANEEVSSALQGSCCIFPTEVTTGSVSLSAPEVVESFWLFDAKGVRIRAQREGLDRGIDLSGVACGNYLAMLLLKDGSWVKQLITLR